MDIYVMYSKNIKTNLRRINNKFNIMIISSLGRKEQMKSRWILTKEFSTLPVLFYFFKKEIWGIPWLPNG